MTNLYTRCMQLASITDADRIALLHVIAKTMAAEGSADEKGALMHRRIVALNPIPVEADAVIGAALSAFEAEGKVKG